jgi:hypothetical protein
MKYTIIALLLVGCKYDRFQSVDPAESNSIVNTMTYLKDHRTGLCFAYFFEKHGFGDAAHGGPGFTDVPCEKVEHLINNGAEAR